MCQTVAGVVVLVGRVWFSILPAKLSSPTADCGLIFLRQTWEWRQSSLPALSKRAMSDGFRTVTLRSKANKMLEAKLVSHCCVVQVHLVSHTPCVYANMHCLFLSNTVVTVVSLQLCSLCTYLKAQCFRFGLLESFFFVLSKRQKPN